ncbi:Williams-Beuren syndrome chromosomal region 27 protein [Tolypocladium ophioglossoides CBS 100239]|uniref:Williams-Beuren syndrome chromosomal region 27 protein n=1 Tax=Tolypocladium ophioglossoides (strain CBS 100239) TaxID=1163406 RepID=A0A0L0MXU7_TOLOC|nr:Williams-Beuren syndrome chromosomal region 27 protein [Tolypocladium ophioglossoides CBS 100239]
MSQLARAYALSDVSATRTLYDEWAHTYDKEMAEATQDYVGPALAGTYTLKCIGPDHMANARLLDAGCGTGLVGVHLAKLGAKNIDGIDLSPGMLDIARRAGVYKSLDTADLSKPIAHEDGSYKAVVCIGTFTQGHVGPEAFSEFVRVVERGGFVIATVLGTIWASGGYEAKVAELAREGKVKILSAEMEDYRRGAGVQARMVVLQVLS